MSRADDDLAGEIARFAVRSAAGGLRLYGRALREYERATLRVLRSRLDAVAPEPPAEPADRRPRTDASPAEAMASLLARSLEQDAAASRTEFLETLVRQLTPDEARIVAALADGAPAPLMHVYRRTVGGRGAPLLENSSLIGRTAAVTVPRLTPSYVSHLRALGLVEVGAEDPDAKRGYELLAAEKPVREALQAGQLGKLPAVVERGTLRLSPLGAELWESCRPPSTEGR